MGDLTDVADVNASLLARALAIWDTVHIHIALIVADKTDPPAVVSLIKTKLEKKYEVDLLDDDDIDAGSADLEIYDLIFVAGDITDMTKINELTTLAVPIATGNPEVALTILRMGDDSGGSGTSWGTAAAQTQVNIVDNTHQITLTLDLGNDTVYTEDGNIKWIRASDLVAGAEELAEIVGDNTKSTLVILPYDVADEDGNPAPMPRVFWGMVEGAKWNSVTETIFYAMLDWLLHQGRRLVEVQGLGKINTIRFMIGTEFVTARNLYDYLVTGTTGASPFEVIAEQESKSVMERLEWIKNGIRRGTGTILPANKSLYNFLLAIPSQAFPFTNPAAALDVSNIRTAAYTLLTDGTYGLSALETLVDEIETLLKGSDESDSFTWDTSAYTTAETDISALFTTPLTGTTRRKYALYLDLTNAEADAAAWTKCTVKVKVKIDGTNYRAVDKKEIAKTDVASTAEPGVPIDIPAVAQDVQITMQFDVALSGDATIYYHTVKQVME